MSACQQAKAKRAKMRNGYAYLGGNPHRPKISGLTRAVAMAVTAKQKKAK